MPFAWEAIPLRDLRFVMRSARQNAGGYFRRGRSAPPVLATVMTSCDPRVPGTDRVRDDQSRRKTGIFAGQSGSAHCPPPRDLFAGRERAAVRNVDTSVVQRIGQQASRRAGALNAETVPRAGVRSLSRAAASPCTPLILQGLRCRRRQTPTIGKDETARHTSGLTHPAAGRATRIAAARIAHRVNNLRCKTRNKVGK